MQPIDFNIISYYFVAVFSAILVCIGIYYTTKLRKTTIQKLEEENKIATETIIFLEKETLSKQKEERANERQRISEELHDGVLGKLFGTRMGLGFLDVSNENNKEKYQNLLNELQEIEKEIREVTHKLSTNLDSTSIGFSAIVDQLLKDKSTIGNFNYSLEIDTSIQWNTIHKVNKVNLYRILQEALQNIVKHAKATEVSVTITGDFNKLFAEIKDNGIGFTNHKNNKGIGVKNMKQRVKRSNGSFEIKSTPNKGTILTLNFPYSFEEQTKIQIQTLR